MGSHKTKGDYILREQEYDTGDGYKCAEKYGVSRASCKYNKRRPYICFWKARREGRVKSLNCRSNTTMRPIGWLSPSEFTARYG